MQNFIEVTPATQNEVVAGKIAHKLREIVLNRDPSAEVVLKRSDPASQNAGDLLLLAVSHVTVIGLIEGARLVWDLFHEPLHIRLPDGNHVIFRGNADVLNDLLKLLPRADDHSEPSP